MELADTSAWTNRHRSQVVLEDFNDRLASGAIATCDMVKLEMLWTVRDVEELVSRRSDLDSLAEVPIGPPVWRRAIDVFEQLAARGPLQHRQVKLPDLLIAAAAESVEMPVAHYDGDFDVIASVTGQPVRAIAPLGSLA
jgi:predicted nucleic acid-binding protein